MEQVEDSIGISLVDSSDIRENDVILQSPSVQSDDLPETSTSTPVRKST